MAKTLFDLTYELARLVKVTSEGQATGGSTTTIADTVERVEEDDYWNGGTAWILYDAGGVGAAPQGEYGYVSDFALTGGIVTLRTALTAAVASGDKYAIARKRYPLNVLIQNINEAIQKIGAIEITDISTITTAAAQTEYTLPSNLLELREVYIQTKLNDTNDYQWERIYDWKVEKESTGSANTLILKQYASGYLVKLVYLGYHSPLRVATDKLDDSIHADRITANAAVGCLLYRKSRVGESDSSVNELLNFYQNLAQQMDAMHPVNQTPKRAKTIDIHFPTSETQYSGDVSRFV